MHALVHSFDDINAKGASRNYNTKPNEKLHGPPKKIYLRQTNFRDVAPQVSFLSHEILQCSHMCLDLRIWALQIYCIIDLWSAWWDWCHRWNPWGLNITLVTKLCAGPTVLWKIAFRWPHYTALTAITGFTCLLGGFLSCSAFHLAGQGIGQLEYIFAMCS